MKPEHADKAIKEFKKHQEHCNICFWQLAIWRCPIGAAYLRAIYGIKHL